MALKLDKPLHSGHQRKFSDHKGQNMSFSADERFPDPRLKGCAVR
jgi:hypothetical protein